jgi:membrane-associated phospholipid phosphatase
VSHLQDTLISDRSAFLRDPASAPAGQSIGAFASLHVAIYVTAALAAHLLALRRSVRIVLWILTGLTIISTVYFGWHYLLDDVGGVAIAVTALALARLLTGCDLAALRRPQGVRVPSMEPA